MPEKIALGVDLGWASQLESMGITWVDSNKNRIDPLQAARELGADAVRLRVFVAPPKEAFWVKPDGTRCMLGFCDAESVLEMSRRVKEQGMRLMLDFHYSDHFADPVYQHIPEDWKGETPEGMARKVAEHTKNVLTLLAAEGIIPEWVQVGNEINPGILLPEGSMEERPEQLIRFLNAGYDAVKECSREIKVVTHVAGVLIWDIYGKFYDRFFAYGGKTDILGISYYPYWYRLMWRGAEGKSSADIEKKLSPAALKPELQKLIAKYGKPVIVTEIGESDEEPEKAKKLLKDTIKVLLEVSEETDTQTGIFYWEPEANRALLPDTYPLGAARLLEAHTLQYTEALEAYRENMK